MRARPANLLEKVLVNARVSRLAAEAVIVLLALGAGKAEAEFRLAGQAKTFANAPGVVEWRYQSIRGPSPFDRIGLHRT